MKAESSLPKERRLENIDIVRVMLVRDVSNPYRANAIKKSEDIASVARKFLANEDREVFIVISLDQSNKINNIHVAAIGVVDKALVHPREIFKVAILSNASFIVLAHNHPSGNPQPSGDDSQITCKLFELGDFLGIKVLDHIIIGDSQYSSCDVFEGKNGKKEIYWSTKNFKDDQEVS